MTGQSGTSHTGTVHSYYGCTEHRKHNCDLQNVRKDILEDIVVNECCNRLTDDAIKMISVEVARLSDEEYNSPIVKGITHRIAECDTAITNLMKALEKGVEVDLILERIQKKRDEKEELQEQLDRETLGHHILTDTEIEFFLRDLRKGSINDFKYRQMLINTMINRIYVYHDRILILFNTEKEPVELEGEKLKAIKEESKKLKKTGSTSVSSHMSDAGVPKKECSFC